MAFAKAVADLFLHFVRVDVADDDEEQVVRRVFLFVVVENVFALQVIEDVGIADDGEAIRAARVSDLEEPARGFLARVVLVHVHLAADDVHLLAQFIGGQRGVHHDVAENVHGDLRARVRHIDVIDGAVERRVSVHVAARVLHLLIDFPRRPIRRALEEHVFEHVRETGAKPLVLVNAPRAAPRLRGNDRRRFVFANDERERVIERHHPHIRRDGGNGIRRYRRGRISGSQSRNHGKSPNERQSAFHGDGKLHERTQRGRRKKPQYTSSCVPTLSR